MKAVYSYKKDEGISLLSSFLDIMESKMTAFR